MIDPSLTITIDRTSLSLSALVLSAAPNVSTLGIVSYREPARERQNAYAESSTYAPRALLASIPSPGFHALTLVPQVTTQSAYDTAVAELEQALTQFTYQVTVTANGAASTTDCDPGSMALTNDRSRIDLAYLKPVWAVTIPVSQ